MVFFNELFQTVGLSKWNLYFDTPSFLFESSFISFGCFRGNGGDKGRG